MLQPISQGIENLLALASELERVDAIYTEKGISGYDQNRWCHPCGTPACALGHYAAMRGIAILQSNGNFSEGFQRLWLRRAEEFGVNERDRADLFGEFGCGNAKTAGEAARYIRDFVAREIEAMSGVPA